MNGQELIERKKHQAEEIAKQFDEMAARIRLNGDANFGGAFLLVPPVNAGTAVQVLTLATNNPGHFWMMVKAHVDEEWKNLQDAAARMRSFG